MSNPMSYFIDNPTDIEDANEDIEVVVLEKTTQIMNRQKKLKDCVDGIKGYPSLVHKLNEWRARDAIFNLRKKAGISIPSYMPRIIIYNGVGDCQAMVSKANDFLRHAEIVNTNKANSYNVSDFVFHYVSDTEAAIKNAFEDCLRDKMNLHGWDELIANPRPAMADWYDWVDVITKCFIRHLKKSGKRHPIFIEMSQTNWNIMCDRFPDLCDYNVEYLKSEYLPSEEMACVLFNGICDKGFIFKKSLKGNLVSLFRKTLQQKGIRQLSETRIRKHVFDSILDRQAKRLQTSTKALTEKRIKTITASDIPGQVIVGNDTVIFY